jgi:hypothetical protein
MAASGTATATVAEMRRVAADLESVNPLWMVMYGGYSREFVAYPRFGGAPGYLHNTSPGALSADMRTVEARVRGARP